MRPRARLLAPSAFHLYVGLRSVFTRAPRGTAWNHVGLDAGAPQPSGQPKAVSRRPRRRRQCVRWFGQSVLLCSALLRQVVGMRSRPAAALFNGRRSRSGTCPPTSHVLFKFHDRRDRRRMIQRGRRHRGMVINSNSHEVSPRLGCPRHWFSHPRRSSHSVCTASA
jgi:hypothetical protein